MTDKTFSEMSTNYFVEWLMKNYVERVKNVKIQIIKDLCLPNEESEYNTIPIEEVAHIIEKRFKEVGL